MNPVEQIRYYAMVEVGLAFGISNHVFAEVFAEVKRYFETDVPETSFVISGITNSLFQHSEVRDVRVRLRPEYIFSRQ